MASPGDVIGELSDYEAISFSGSLLVTNPGASPVGLLFAGNQNGSFAVANRIQDVLSAFGVTGDGS